MDFKELNKVVEGFLDLNTENEPESLIAHCFNLQGELDIILDLIVMDDEFNAANPEFEETLRKTFHMVTDMLKEVNQKKYLPGD